MIGSQGSAVRPHGNCLSLPTNPHTQRKRVFFIASLCICPFFTQQLSTLSLSWLLPSTELQLVRGVPWAISHPDALQLFSYVWLFVTPWTAACQASLCDPLDCSILGFPVLHHLLELAQTTSIELVMPSNHLVLCHLLLHLPSIFTSIRVFSNESALCIRYWNFSFSISPSNEYSGLISFRIDWFDLLAVQRFSRVFSNIMVQKHQFFRTQPSLWSNSHIHTWLLEKLGLKCLIFVMLSLQALYFPVKF